MQFRSNKNYVFYKKACNLLGTRANAFRPCEICNLNETENVHHVFCRCPHYKNVRNRLSKEIGYNLSDMNQEDFYKVLFNVECKPYFIEMLCNAWKICMKIRDFLCTY